LHRKRTNNPQFHRSRRKIKREPQSADGAKQNFSLCSNSFFFSSTGTFIWRDVFFLFRPGVS
jgi:hypothetical protein